MRITFQTRKLEKTFNSERELRKEYGAEQAKKIRLRMGVLASVCNLAEVPTDKPDRRHQLKGNREGQFAVDLAHPYRLIFQPEGEIPLREDGGIDLKRVASIVIIDVEDYHGE